jgi:hypothetical protein
MIGREDTLPKEISGFYSVESKHQNKNIYKVNTIERID